MLIAAAPSQAVAVRLVLRMDDPPYDYERARQGSPVYNIPGLLGDSAGTDWGLPSDGLDHIGIIANGAMAARETLGLYSHLLYAVHELDQIGIGHRHRSPGIPEVGNPTELRIRNIGDQ